jgi:hypothetical protein
MKLEQESSGKHRIRVPEIEEASGGTLSHHYMILPYVMIH